MRPLPNDEQLLALIHALLANASSLVDDATLLLDHGRHARAYALAALASEELGKVYLCLDALLGDGMQDRQFWNLWREHRDKLVSARTYAAAFVDDLDQIDFSELSPDAEHIGETKMASIYVDFRDEQLMTPQRIDPEESDRLLSAVRRSIEHARWTFEGFDLDVLAAIQQARPHLEVITDRLLADPSPHAIVAAMRSFVSAARSLTPEELNQLVAPASPPEERVRS